MGCISGIVKTIMFIFNFACLLVGLVLLVLGALFYVSVDAYKNSFVGGIVAVPIVLIIIGVIIFLLSFLGCCGTIKSNKCMLITYAVILIIMLVVQLAIGIYGLVQINDNKDEFKKNIKQEMLNVLHNSINGDKVAKEVMNALQAGFKCCGVHSFADYYNGGIPGTCCGKLESESCLTGMFPNGCGDVFFEQIEVFTKNVSIAAIVLCAVELLGALFAIYLSRKK